MKGKDAVLYKHKDKKKLAWEEKGVDETHSDEMQSHRSPLLLKTRHRHNSWAIFNLDSPEPLTLSIESSGSRSGIILLLYGSSYLTASLRFCFVRWDVRGLRPDCFLTACSTGDVTKDWGWSATWDHKVIFTDIEHTQQQPNQEETQRTANNMWTIFTGISGQCPLGARRPGLYLLNNIFWVNTIQGTLLRVWFPSAKIFSH